MHKLEQLAVQLFAVIIKSPVFENEGAHQTALPHIGEFTGKPNKASALKVQIVGKWFRIIPNFINTPSPSKGISP